MERRIQAYLAYLKKLTEQMNTANFSLQNQMPPEAEASQSNEEHVEPRNEILRTKILTQIQFFQHERLIHLIVTMTFALMTIVTMAASILSGSMLLLGLFGLLLILLVPYIRHYYILENDVQKMYEYYDLLFDGWKNLQVH